MQRAQYISNCFIRNYKCILFICTTNLSSISRENIGSWHEVNIKANTAKPELLNFYIMRDVIYISLRNKKYYESCVY